MADQKRDDYGNGDKKKAGASVTVWAKAGPLAGRRVDIPEEDLDAATNESGWAQKLEPGTELVTDPAIPFNPAWKIPGYEAPPEVAQAAKAQQQNQNGTQAKSPTAPVGSTRVQQQPSGSQPAPSEQVQEPAPKEGSTARPTTTKPSSR